MFIFAADKYMYMSQVPTTVIFYLAITIDTSLPCLWQGLEEETEDRAQFHTLRQAFVQNRPVVDC